MVYVAPSLLSANCSCLGEEVARLEKANADLIHFDVMDGHFVPNITYGPMILKALKKSTSLLFDVHLMVDNPARFIPWYAKAGADIITFHIETTDNADELIRMIKECNIKAGVTLKPDTNVRLLANLKELPDMVLVMGVEPGFGGQKFREDTPQRIIQTKKLFSDSHVKIEVDGGINPDTAKKCILAGADILVAGAFVFQNEKYEENIKMIKGEL